MIQIIPQDPFTSSLRLEPPAPSSSHLLIRLLYGAVMVVLLLGAVFYFDLLSNYDLVSLLLGFITCLVLQFSFLSYYFQKEMQQYGIDEIGVLKWKVKGFFGELNPTYVHLKNRVKYYRHEGNTSDRLFRKDNDDIYQNVLGVLRGGRQENVFQEMITTNKLKWAFLEEKIVLLNNFFSTMLKQYQKRKSAYNKHKHVLTMLDNNESIKWETFLREEGKQQQRLVIDTQLFSQSLQQLMSPSLDLSHQTEFKRPTSSKAQSTKQSKDSKSKKNKDRVEMNVLLSQEIKLDWSILSWFLQEKNHITDIEIRCLKENIITEFEGFVRSVRSARQNSDKERDRLLSEVRIAKEEKQAIDRLIEKIAKQMVELKQNLNSNHKKGEGDNVESILQDELNQRLLRNELQNLQIKNARAHSLKVATAEKLYIQLQGEESQLEDQMHKFNSKFKNYINMLAGQGQNTCPELEKYVKDYKNIPDWDTEDQTIQGLNNAYAQRKKDELFFKSYLHDTLKLLKEVNTIHNETHKLLTDFQRRFEDTGTRKNRRVETGTRLHYYTNNIKDLKLLKTFDKLNYFNESCALKLVGLIERQIDENSGFDKKWGTLFGRTIKDFQEQWRRQEEAKKRGMINMEQQPSRIADNLSNQVKIYMNEYRIETVLTSVIQVMADQEFMCQRYANELAEEEQYELRKEGGNDEESQARTKLSAFQQWLHPQQMADFDEGNFTPSRVQLFEPDKDEEYKSKGQFEVWTGGKPTPPPHLKMIMQRPYKENSARSTDLVNRLLCVLFNEWCNSEFFHEFVKEELTTSLNRKRPDIVEHLTIQHFKIVQKDKDINPIKKISTHNTEIFRLMLDVTINFKGKIAVQIGTKLRIGSRPPLKIRLLIKEFECPIRICFTPYKLGKSYASLLQRPRLVIDYSVHIGSFALTKIPFFSFIIRLAIVHKLRRKMLWPKRITISVPLAVKSTIELAIQQRNKYEKDQERIDKRTKGK